MAPRLEYRVLHEAWAQYSRSAKGVRVPVLTEYQSGPWGFQVLTEYHCPLGPLGLTPLGLTPLGLTPLGAHPLLGLTPFWGSPPFGAHPLWGSP